MYRHSQRRFGTGLYMIAEHVPDQYLQLVKFPGYVSRSEPP
jgi:peptide/nickel transport system substrate-binding protein